MNKAIDSALPEAGQASRFDELKDKLGEVGRAIAEDVGGAPAALSEKACGLAGATRDCVARNPWAVAGIAAAIGVLVGSLLGRRGKGT